MKPLTKTVVSRGGGIAARFAVSNEPVANPSLTVANDVVVSDAEALRQPGTKVLVTGQSNPSWNGIYVVPRWKRWREKNPELYKQRQAKYQAEYRKRRAKEKAGK